MKDLLIDIGVYGYCIAFALSLICFNKRKYKWQISLSVVALLFVSFACIVALSQYFTL